MLLKPIFKQHKLFTLVKTPFFVAVILLTGFLDVRGQNTCNLAVPLSPGQQQCGNTALSGNGVSNNDCLGAWDDGNDFFFSLTPSSDQDGFVLILDLVGDHAEMGIALTRNCPEGSEEICLAEGTGSSSQTLVSPPLAAGKNYYLHISSLSSNPDLSFCLNSQFGPSGCTNPLASNFQPDALIDDGNCIFPDPLEGCGTAGNSVAVAIPDGGMLEDTLNLNLPVNAVLKDLDLVLFLEHAYLPDLKISLRSPLGTQILLVNDACPGEDTIRVHLDDDSGTWNCQSVNGGFLAPPASSLAQLNGEPAQGDWTLVIEDDALGDQGKLLSWCLLPEWEAVTCLSPSGISITNTTATTAVVSWNETNTPPATEWEVALVSAGEFFDGVPNYTGVSDQTLLLEGLESAQTYELYVRSRCGILPGSWSNPRQFTTAISNPSACGLGIPIADCSIPALTQFPVTVMEAPGMALGVDVFLKEVRVIAEHDYVSDIDFFLISPNGISVELTTDNGGGGQNLGIPGFFDCQGATIFSQEACSSVNDEINTAPFLGAYRPEGNLTDFYDGSSPLGNWTLVICDDAGDDSGTLEYIELVFDSVVCTAPPIVVIDSTGADFAYFSWLPDGICTNYIIEYGSAGFIPGTGIEPGSLESETRLFSCGSTFPIILDNLDETSFYEVVIRKECSPGFFSVNGCPFDFITDCSSGAVSVQETFDNENLCSTTCGETCSLGSAQWENGREDDFDWIVDEGKTPTSKTGPEDDVSGGGRFLYIETSNSDCPEGGKATLLSSCLEVVADSGNCHFSFYYHMSGVDINQLHLLATSTETLSWDTLWIVSGDQGNRWHKAFIDLSVYQGETIRLRFDGYKGAGIRGDIAIDHFAFHGSEFKGFPTYRYFADRDQDGFGNPQDSIVSCNWIPPAGYVPNNLDCDDTDESINPAAQEIPCNQVDENCNGKEDDAALPAPIIDSMQVCEGVDTAIHPISIAFGVYYWKKSSVQNAVALAGNSFPFSADSSQVLWVQDSLVVDGYACRSEFVPVEIVVIEGPGAVLADSVIQCPGEVFYLNEINQSDSLSSGTVISWYFDYPDGTPLSNPFVDLDDSQTLIMEAVSGGGCVEVDSTELIVYAPPMVAISPEGPLAVCTGKQSVLTAQWTSESPFVQIEWSNGFQDSIILISGIGNPGNKVHYSVEITDAYGCQGADTIEVLTAAGISAASVDQVFPVTNCNGTNGAMVISPLNGTPPYSYQWSGPVSGNASGVDSTVVINNLKQGVYRITITDNSSSECPLILPLVVVNGPSATVNQIQVKDVTCAGSQDGAIFLQVSGNNPQFSWSTGSVSPFIFGLEGGSYSVTIQDGTCSLILEDIVVEEPEPLQLFDAQVQDVRCNNGADGAIQVVALGGSGGYLYEWSNGIFNSKINNLVSGNYSLTVSDFNGCALTESFWVNEPDPLFLEVDSISPVSCYGAADGAIYTSAWGGLPPYLIVWQNGLEGEDLSGLVTGIYSMSLTDFNGCSLTGGAVVLPEPEPLTVTIADIQHASCNGVADGMIDLNVAGGTSPYWVEWDNGSEGTNPVGLGAGFYTPQITDSKGCITSSGPIEIFTPEVLEIEVDQIANPSCLGRADGSIKLSVTGGLPPYHYLWNSGDTTALVTELDFGVYSCTIRDENGCLSSFDSIALVSTQLLSGTIDFVNDLTCYGADDGQIFITASGGTDPYNYSWSDGVNWGDRQDLPPGKYNCSVTDSEGCLLVFPTVEVKEPPLLEINLNSIEPVLCNGFSNGSIDVSVTGGVPPYQFSWDDGSNLEDLQAAPAGTYKITVLDKNACLENLESLYLPEPAPFAFQTSSFEDLGCGGNNGGGVDVSIAGGTAPYSYLWSNGEIGEDLSNVTPGTYGLTITDENQCMMIQPAIVVHPPLDSMVVELDTVIPVSCFAEQDGSVVAGIKGGSPPYQYLWNIGVDSTLALSDLAPGNYQLTVTDARGCTGISQAATLPAPQPLSILITSIVPPVCPGDSSGAILTSVSGGTGPYMITWFSSGSGTPVSGQANAQGLPAGTYYAMLTDANGCETFSAPVVLPASEPLEVNLTGLLPSCAGDSTGKIFISLTGGIPPFSYLWNNGEVSKNITGVSPGIYQVTITDGKGCQHVSDAIFVDALTDTPLEVMVDSLQAVSCYGEKTGLIRVDGQGGLPPYQYSWSNGNQTSLLSSVFSGIYSCTVTDANGCKAYLGGITVGQPDTVLYYQVDQQQDALCPNGNEGWIDLSAAGGTAPYQYFWTNGAQSDSITDLTAGQYRCTITDGAGCSKTTDYLIVGAPLPFSIEVTVLAATFGQSNGTIDLEVSGGTEPYSFLWDAGTGGQTTSYLEGLPGGNYSVTVTDGQECDTSLTVEVNEVTALSPAPEYPGADFRVFPNPASTAVTFENRGDVSGIWSIQFFLPTGQEIGSFRCSDSRFTLDITSWSVGPYFYRIQDEAGNLLATGLLLIQQF